MGEHFLHLRYFMSTTMSDLTTNGQRLVAPFTNMV